MRKHTSHGARASLARAGTHLARAGASPAPTLLRGATEIVQGRGGACLSLGGCLQQAVARGVILSAAKDLSLCRTEILRCAQDDSLWRPTRFKKPTSKRRGACPRPGCDSHEFAPLGLVTRWFVCYL